MTPDEYMSHDALGLAGLVRDREVTAEELVEIALERTDEVQPGDKRRGRAPRRAGARRGRVRAARGIQRGPVHGQGYGRCARRRPNTASSRSLVTWRPAQDSELFARYKAAGLLIAGKTNCPEFGIFGITESELRGPARNPWDLNHTPGFLGWIAAAVAARIVPMAHAGDGGGSIRIPASCCGLFGL